LLKECADANAKLLGRRDHGFWQHAQNMQQGIIADDVRTGRFLDASHHTLELGVDAIDQVAFIPVPDDFFVSHVSPRLSPCH
jgi:hypothetical protein